MVQLLGFVDLIAAGILFSFLLYVRVPIEALIFIPFCLACKSFLYLSDIGSITDIFALILIVLGIFFHLPQLLLLIGAVLILFKGVMSFIVIA